MFTPGEAAADPYIGYLTNQTITGLYAQEVEGAVLMVEREFAQFHCINCLWDRILTARQTDTGATPLLTMSSMPRLCST